jgi:hypothetical protein
VKHIIIHDMLELVWKSITIVIAAVLSCLKYLINGWILRCAWLMNVSQRAATLEYWYLTTDRIKELRSQGKY